MHLFAWPYNLAAFGRLGRKRVTGNSRLCPVPPD